MKKNKTFFVELLGNSPQVKVIDFFIDNYSFDYSIIEISKETKTGYSTLKQMLPRLVNKKILIINRKLGKIKFYKLNIDNPVVIKLRQFDWSLTKQK